MSQKSYKTNIVNLIGGPGSGKTLNATRLFYKLKLKGRLVEYVSEYAKKLVWLNDFDTLNDQYLVSNKQFKLLKAMEHRVPYVVTDACLLHGLYYNKFHPDNVSNVEKTHKKILESYNTFNNINIFIVRGSYPYEQAGRYQSESAAKEIDAHMEQILIDSGIKYMRFNPDVQNLKDVLEYILSFEDKS